MSEAVRKGKVLGTVLWYALMGIPVAAGGYLIYSKQHALGVDDAPPSAAAVAAAQLEAPTTVAVAPRYADPEMLRQKEAQDALLRRDFELRLAKERESLGAGSGPSTRPAKGRVITLGPSANPEKPVEQDPNAAYERAAADANAAREEAARKARGPQMHEVAEDHRDSERRREAELRQQGVQVNSTRGGETPLLPFSGTSTGSYGSSNSRPRSPSRR